MIILQLFGIFGYTKLYVHVYRIDFEIDSFKNSSAPCTRYAVSSDTALLSAKWSATSRSDIFLADSAAVERWSILENTKFPSSKFDAPFDDAILDIFTQVG